VHRNIEPLGLTHSTLDGKEVHGDREEESGCAKELRIGIYPDHRHGKGGVNEPVMIEAIHKHYHHTCTQAEASTTSVRESREQKPKAECSSPRTSAASPSREVTPT